MALILLVILCYIMPGIKNCCGLYLYTYLIYSPQKLQGVAYSFFMNRLQRSYTRVYGLYLQKFIPGFLFTDGIEAKYTESAFHGSGPLPPRRDNDMSFEQMLLDMKKKLSQRKGDKKDDFPRDDEIKTKNDDERCKRDDEKPKRDDDRPKRDEEMFRRTEERSKRDDEKCKRDEEKSKRDDDRPKRDEDRSKRDEDRSKRDDDRSKRDIVRSKRGDNRTKRNEAGPKRDDKRRDNNA